MQDSIAKHNLPCKPIMVSTTWIRSAGGSRFLSTADSAEPPSAVTLGGSFPSQALFRNRIPEIHTQVTVSDYQSAKTGSKSVQIQLYSWFASALREPKYCK